MCIRDRSEYFDGAGCRLRGDQVPVSAAVNQSVWADATRRPPVVEREDAPFRNRRERCRDGIGLFSEIRPKLGPFGATGATTEFHEGLLAERPAPEPDRLHGEGQCHALFVAETGVGEGVLLVVHHVPELHFEHIGGFAFDRNAETSQQRLIPLEGSMERGVTVTVVAGDRVSYLVCAHRSVHGEEEGKEVENSFDDFLHDLRRYSPAISFSTLSSTARNGSLHRTVRWVWSFSFRWTQSTVKSLFFAFAALMKSPRSRARVVAGAWVAAVSIIPSVTTRSIIPLRSSMWYIPPSRLTSW